MEYKAKIKKLIISIGAKIIFEGRACWTKYIYMGERKGNVSPVSHHT